MIDLPSTPDQTVVKRIHGLDKYKPDYEPTYKVSSRSKQVLADLQSFG